ncbi:MAG: DUF433 domain-containing protein [Acidobacteria bacterium]|nr:DUF433 domain-containing protein [Acidobacteriota bacterium]
MSKAAISCAMPTSPAKYLFERRQRRQAPVLVRIERPVDEALVKKRIRALAERLCVGHPAINMDAEVLSGTPHVENTRLSVGNVLAKLYLYGSIQAVVKIHEPHLSEKQIKDAIAYAQDFLEIACDPHETP